MTEKNFLEDPGLYFDELPQPFFFLHKLIFRILDLAWDRFLLSEKQKHADHNLESLSLNPVNQTEIPDNEITFVDFVMTKFSFEEEKIESSKMLAMANRVHLLYFKISCSYQTEQPVSQHKLPVDAPLKLLHVLLATGRFSLVRGRDLREHVQYHALSARDSYQVCCLPEAESIHVTDVTEDDPYIIFTCSENEEIFLLIYTYPVTQWTDTIGSLLSLEGEEVETTRQMPTFSKPILIAKIGKPLPMRPTNLMGSTDTTPFSDPKAYFNGVGHPMSHEYFRNQFKLFHSCRRAFQSDLITETSVRLPLTSPHFNTVLSETQGSRKDVAVWWGGGLDLFFYSFPTNPKDTNVYPVSYMNQAHPILCSAVSTGGNVLALGYFGSITLWKFPDRFLLKYLPIGEFVGVSLIQFIPALDSSGTKYVEKFVCTVKSKIHLVDVDTRMPLDSKLTLLNQTHEPSLPPVLEVQELILSPRALLLLFSHEDGVRSLRNLADSPPTLAVLRSDRSCLASVCAHFSVGDRQLHLVVGERPSTGLLLQRYDLVRLVRRIGGVEMGREPTVPTEEDLRKPLFSSEGIDTIKGHVIQILEDRYSRREEISAKAKEVWEELENFFKM